MAGCRTASTPATSVAGVLLAVTLIVASATPAMAYWTGEGTGTAGSTTGALAAPADVTAPATSGTDVNVSWTASAGALAPTGYYISRISGGEAGPACGTDPSTLTTEITCVDAAVEDGTHSYVVTAVYRSWTARSTPSDLVLVTGVPDGRPVLGAATGYSVLGGNVVNTLATTVSGDLGVSPAGAVGGFPPGTIAGILHLNDPDAAAARAAMIDAYAEVAARPPTSEFSGDLNGVTFTAGVHHTAAALTLTGTMTLSGDASSIFIFQVDAALNTAASSHIVLTGGALASNVFWQVNGAAGTGANSTFAGTILADGAVTLGADSELVGRALAIGTVTLAGNAIRFTEALPPTIAITPGAATKDTTPTISGTTTAGVGRTVTVTVGGQTLVTTVQIGGSWSVTAAELPASSHLVVARVKDAAGNGATAERTLVVEVNPVAIDLGTSVSYAVLAETTVVSTGVSALGGDLGVGVGGTITGFPPGTVDGVIHIGDASSAAAKSAFLAAYTDGRDRVAHTEFAGDQNGRTFHVGVHHTSAAFSLTGTMILDGEGDPNAVFIFQIDAAMDTAAGSIVLLTNGATAANVFWIVDGAAGTGADSVLVGTVLANGPVTLGADSQLTGRLLSTGAVTLADNVVETP